MNQMFTDPGAPANTGTEDPGASARTGTRRRRSSGRARPAAASSTAPLLAEPTASEPLAAPAAEQSAPPQEAAPRTEGRGRGSRGGTSRRRGARHEPELVLPPSAQEEPTSAAPLPEAAAAEQHAPQPTAQATAPTTAQAPADAAAPRRYRFGRPTRPLPFPEMGAPRQERLSGGAEPAATAVQDERPAPVQQERQERAAPEEFTADVSDEPGDHYESGAVEEFAAQAEDEQAPTEAGEGTGGRTSRRRRRRRSGTGVAHLTPPAEYGEEEIYSPPSAARAAPSRAAEVYSEPEEQERMPSGGGTYGGDFWEPYTPLARGRTEEATPWHAGQAQQQAQEPLSPFGSPEPAFARGFGPQPAGVAGPARETYPRTSRGERGLDTPPMSANQLGAVLSQAIQRQTEQLLTELRQQQQPTNMVVRLPALPTQPQVSLERVGVFVDVANIVYSARSMRLNVDFGRLLDFLRGNRRLIRAQAYAPTDPAPHAEQAFLSVVRGMGYRITTKNYKTFASGAKKADMDLDLCMDIVRMVDAKALDTVVLVSGDSDFLPVLEYCSDHGVRVEVAAFDDAASAILRQSCDIFINLSLVEAIRG